MLVVSKTEEEIQEILKRKEAKIKEKEERRKKQEQNIVQKKEKKEEHKYLNIFTFLCYTNFLLVWE